MSRGILIALLLTAWVCRPAGAGSIREFLRLAGPEATGGPSAPRLGARDLGSWLDNAELRLSLDDDKDRVQTYELRLKPKSGRQHDAEQAIADLHADRAALRRQEHVGSQLRLRYERLLTLAREQSELAALRAGRALADTEAQAYRGLARTADFRPERLQQVEIERHKLEVQEATRGRRVLNLLEEMGLADASEEVTTARLVPGWTLSLEELARITTLAPGGAGPSTAPKLRAAALDARLAREELRREEGRQGLGVDFLRLELQHSALERVDDV